MAFVQKTNGTGTTTASATLAGIGAGSTIVAFCWNGSSTTPTVKTCVDGQGIYAAQGAPVTDATNNIWTQIFTLQNANAGSHTATFTSDSGAAVEIELLEMTAPTTGAVIGTNGAHQSNPGGTADALSSGSITIAVSATLLGMSSDTGNVSALDEPSAGTGFTSRDNSFDSVIGSWRVETKAVSASAAATFTASAVASSFVTVAVAIAEPPAASPLPIGQACL